MTPFVKALVDLATEEGNTSTLETIRNLALQKIAGGEARSLVSSSINGKSFNFQVSKPADVLFAEASEAIRLFGGNSVTQTEIDFSNI